MDNVELSKKPEKISGGEEVTWTGLASHPRGGGGGVSEPPTSSSVELTWDLITCYAVPRKIVPTYSEVNRVKPKQAPPPITVLHPNLHQKSFVMSIDRPVLIRKKFTKLIKMIKNNQLKKKAYHPREVTRPPARRYTFKKCTCSFLWSCLCVWFSWTPLKTLVKTSAEEPVKSRNIRFFINPLTLNSDQHLISPYNIIPESHIKVMRIKEMITKWRSSWILWLLRVTSI